MKSFITFLLLIPVLLQAQDPLRFKGEVDALTAVDSIVNKKNLILFTGSSSVRLWTTLKEDFPNHNILNRGFGGSEMSDMVYYADKLIFPYKPDKVFIYEGDNDLGVGEEPDAIMGETIKLARSIKDHLPNTEIFFISPKPSLLRWHLKAKYELYMGKLKSWCVTQKGITFIDVWTPMLDSTGAVKKDLFLDDGLHMNRKGYEIWVNIIGPYLK
jgi:lysophospholipase L1-like esterase